MRRALALGVALLLLLSGCGGSLTFLPQAREIENVALMRAVGVDAAEAGAVSITASGGVQRDEGQAVVLDGKAPSISAALLGMQAQDAAHIFYGHVDRLLLGEDLAHRGVGPALDYVLRDIEMRLDTRLYVVQGGTAGEVLNAAAQSGGSVADRLEVMEADGGLASSWTHRTVGEALTDLAATGATFAPALALSPAGELEPVGYALIKEGRLVGWAEGDTARGLNLLLGEVEADVVTLLDTALRVVEVSTHISPIFHGERLIGLAVHCKVEANVAEEPPGGGMGDRTRLAELEKALAEVEQARLREMLALIQGLDADAPDLLDRACLAAPWRAEAIRAQWDLPTLALEVTVKAQIRRGYDVDE